MVSNDERRGTCSRERVEEEGARGRQDKDGNSPSLLEVRLLGVGLDSGLSLVTQRLSA